MGSISTSMVKCTCELCGGVHNITRPTLMVSNERNCAELAIDLCLLEGYRCFSTLKMYEDSCCTNNNISNFYVRSEKEKYSYPQGSFPVCWLCSKPGKMPYVKSMVINILSLQAGSCIQYYHYGRLGHIQPNICSALQALAKVPCGC